MANEPICIDLNFQDKPGVISSWLVQSVVGWVIVDCGPATAQAALEAGVHAAGLEMADVERIVLTHIHLDHGGGSGVLLRDHPHLRVSVHEDSADILIDPTRLIRSATKSYGDDMDRLWGEIAPVDASRIDTIRPGDTVPGTSLRAIATPGHTATHLAYIDTNSAVLFTGDAALARLQGSDVIVPTLSPVEVDVDAWAATAKTMKALAPSALALPHFGLHRDVAEHLSQIEDRIAFHMDVAARIVRSADDQDALAAALAAATRAAFEAEGGDAEAKIATMDMAMSSTLGAQGIMRWYKVHDKFTGT